MAESQKDVDETIVEDAVEFLSGTAPFIMENDMIPHVFSNEPYNPVPYGLLDILYRQVFENRVGVFVGKDTETGEHVDIICFVGDKGDEDVALYPIARLLKEAEVERYRAPTGDGGYFDYTVPSE